MPETPITQAGLDRVENNLRREMEKEVSALRDELKGERELRETTEKLGRLALDKAEKFISEKSEEHNNLIQKMERDAAHYITRDAVKKEILFYVTLASFAMLVLAQVLRVLLPIAP